MVFLLVEPSCRSEKAALEPSLGVTQVHKYTCTRAWGNVKDTLSLVECTIWAFHNVLYMAGVWTIDWTASFRVEPMLLARLLGTLEALFSYTNNITLELALGLLILAVSAT